MFSLTLISRQLEDFLIISETAKKKYLREISPW